MSTVTVPRAAPASTLVPAPPDTPSLTFRDLAWHDRAACQYIDPDLWFPEEGASSRSAKRVCRGCPVRAECLAHALEHNEPFGVWGGTTEMERRDLKSSALDIAGVLTNVIAREQIADEAREARHLAYRQRGLAAERAKRARVAEALAAGTGTEGAAA